MICDICGQNHASIVIQRMTEQTTEKFYICNSCAKKHELYTDEKKLSLSLYSLLNNLTDSGFTSRTTESEPSLLCPECGTSLQHLKEHKMLGCPLCFFYFKDAILTIMKKMSTEVCYTGVLPEKCETFANETVSLMHLKQELELALENEEYELAAYFRDKIKEREACP